ncbi:MAG: ATP synthase F0 subunit B [Vicinamibacterales bacterium]
MIPGPAIIWVVLIVLLLAFVLDRWLFRPLVGVMEERAATVRSARELAELSAEKARRAAAEFEASTRAAQAEIYRQMDETRRAALEERAAMLAATREDVKRAAEEAAARLDKQVAEAEARLEQEAGRLGAEVVERVLGRNA